MAIVTEPAHAMPHTIKALPKGGAIIPLITPLNRDGSVDGASMESLVNYVIDAGVTGVLVLGSSGENGAISAESRETAVRHAVASAQGRVHVMAGVAALGTVDAVESALRFETLGVDSLLVPAPFVFTPSDEEMRTHFAAVAERVTIPVVAYDVPSRVGVALSAPLLVRLGNDGIIAGVKDSSNDLAKPRTLVELTRDHPSFVCYTGVEEAVDSLLLAGYDAAIPGLGNVFPHSFVALARYAAARDWDRAHAEQSRIIGLLELYSAPIPGASPTARFFAAVKEALRQLHVIANNTSSLPFHQSNEDVERYVSRVLSRADVPVA